MSQYLPDPVVHEKNIDFYFTLATNFFSQQWHYIVKNLNLIDLFGIFLVGHILCNLGKTGLKRYNLKVSANQYSSLWLEFN